jgi:hypothetical protein
LAVAVAGALAALLTGVLMVAREPVTADTTWFLQVVHRVRSGQALYRDVFFGAGPLPVWLACLAVAVGGESVRTLRVLSALVYAGTVAPLLLLVSSSAGAAAAGALVLPLLGLTGLVWPGDHLYPQLSRLGVAWTAVALTHGAGAAPLVLAGAATAVACLGKYTLGTVTGAVATAGLALASGPATAVFYVGVTALALAPAVVALGRQGLLWWFVERAVLNKRTFVATGRMSPREGVLPHLPRRGTPPLQRAVGLVALTAFGLLALGPVLLGTALAIAGAPQHRGTALAVVLLVAVSWSSAFPRTDQPHVTGTAPLLLGAAGAEAGLLGGAVATAVPVVLGTAGVAALVVAWQHWRGPGRLPVSSRRPWHGVPAPDLPPEAGALGDALREATGGVVFLLRPDAALWYLACGLTNPTPYDYPLASTFGPTGQQEVAQQLRDGRIGWCCVQPARHGALTPTHLEEFVERELVRVGETPLGTLYRTPAL